METLHFNRIEEFEEYVRKLELERQKENPSEGQGGMIKHSKLLFRGVFKFSIWTRINIREKNKQALFIPFS